jgi:hypothetical protein
MKTSSKLSGLFSSVKNEVNSFFFWIMRRGAHYACLVVPTLHRIRSREPEEPFNLASQLHDLRLGPRERVRVRQVVKQARHNNIHLRRAEILRTEHDATHGDTIKVLQNRNIDKALSEADRRNASKPCCPVRSGRHEVTSVTTQSASSRYPENVGNAGGQTRKGYGVLQNREGNRTVVGKGMEIPDGG